MNKFSNIKTTIGNNDNSDPNDILQTRRNFRKIGIEAGEEDRPIIDKPLDNGIRIFQREFGLKEDGIIHPKGETEEALKLVLQVKEIMPKPEKKPDQHKTPPLPERKPDRNKTPEEILEQLKKTPIFGKRLSS